jgi:hypothetical protein
MNEKTTANPRNWPLIRGHLAPQGDGSLDARCFFRAGRRIVRARFFGTFEPAKVQEKNTYLNFLCRVHVSSYKFLENTFTLVNDHHAGCS